MPAPLSMTRARALGAALANASLQCPGIVFTGLFGAWHRPEVWISPVRP
jgi:hypothetical protein